MDFIEVNIDKKTDIKYRVQWCFLLKIQEWVNCNDTACGLTPLPLDGDQLLQTSYNGAVIYMSKSGAHDVTLVGKVIRLYFIDVITKKSLNLFQSSQTLETMPL